MANTVKASKGNENDGEVIDIRSKTNPVSKAAMASKGAGKAKSKGSVEAAMKGQAAAKAEKKAAAPKAPKVLTAEQQAAKDARDEAAETRRVAALEKAAERKAAADKKQEEKDARAKERTDLKKQHDKEKAELKKKAAADRDKLKKEAEAQRKKDMALVTTGGKLAVSNYGIPGLEVTEKGVVIPEGAEVLKVKSMAERFVRVAMAGPWVTGDGLAYLAKNFTLDYTLQLSQLGVARSTLKNYKMVCELFPLSDRIEGVEFGHYLEAASLYRENPVVAMTVLREAAENGYPTTQVRRMVIAIRAVGVPTPEEGAAGIEAMARRLAEQSHANVTTPTNGNGPKAAAPAAIAVEWSSVFRKPTEEEIANLSNLAKSGAPITEEGSDDEMDMVARIIEDVETEYVEKAIVVRAMAVMQHLLDLANETIDDRESRLGDALAEIKRLKGERTATVIEGEAVTV